MLLLRYDINDDMNDNMNNLDDLMNRMSLSRLVLLVLNMRRREPRLLARMPL